MKFMEINARLEEILTMLEPDENGEVMPTDEIFAELDALQMEKEEIIEGVCKSVKATEYEIDAVSAEIKRLTELKARLNNRKKRSISYLEYITNGVKTTAGTFTVSYRTTKALEVTDSASARAWLDTHGFTDYYTVGETKISKSDVKKLVDSGEDIPGCEIKENRSCAVR